MQDNNFLSLLLDKCLAADPDAVAFVLYDGSQQRQVSYRQFARDVLAAAGYFTDRGIYSRHIALAAPNSYEWIVVFFGILCSGNVAVPLNPALPSDILSRQMDKTDVRYIYTDPASVGEVSRCLTPDKSLLPAFQSGRGIRHQDPGNGDPQDGHRGRYRRLRLPIHPVIRCSLLFLPAQKSSQGL